MMDERHTVVPCFYKLEYIEWKDRGEGSGRPIHP